jgi:hypothetical protein
VVGSAQCGDDEKASETRFKTRRRRGEHNVDVAKFALELRRCRVGTVADG